ncbi:cell wall hydrolase [Altererythrobacter sp. B11]|uniref:cell wall hydrolase n=1 Tax=Altererythrobacter sp. B11 TaxID=2060312 RepID=UPI000DC70F67|nr:cell wall hydrolase [Altererythrobacter sp. B11]BBC70946.1 cell wall hydrolase [Altererythrobacter sp. B11]
MGGAVAAYMGIFDSYLSTAPAGGEGQAVLASDAPPPPPAIEPVEFLDLAPETAKEINDSVPFTTEPVPAAAPLSLIFSTPEDQQRAADCLAAAAWYEAGNDTVGESAVVQVVLNRLRHAAFPKTVCGVVFQGSERQTGCQFTFTCDGSMIRRRPSASAWLAAQSIALTGMRGVVFPQIGWATHYHTDQVVPNWSSSVDKVAAVKTHLFFRWRGANGRPRAFQARYGGGEPIVAAMAGLSPAHGEKTEAADDPAPVSLEAAPLTVSDDLAGQAPAQPPQVNLRGSTLTRGNRATNLYVLQLEPGQLSGSTALTGVELCKGVQTACTVAGFVGQPGRALAQSLGKVTFPDRNPDFYYFVDRSRGRERVLWNCNLVSRTDRSQCLSGAFEAEG